MDKFFTQKNCDRCRKPFDGSRTMSRFNPDCICEWCAEEEQSHPDYRKAVDAEMEQIRNGNRNFEGIGWPGRNGRVK